MEIVWLTASYLLSLCIPDTSILLEISNFARYNLVSRAESLGFVEEVYPIFQYWMSSFSMVNTIKGVPIGVYKFKKVARFPYLKQ